MSPPPRRLTFAVGTSLLSASLALGVAGCTEGSGKPEAAKAKTPDPAKSPDPEQIVNIKPMPVPVPEPEPDPKQIEPPHVNEGPEPEPETLEPLEKKAAEPERRVNTRSPGL